MSRRPKDTPADCLDGRVRRSWDEMNDRLPLPKRANTPCVDCLPSWQDEMRDIGRCGRPIRGRRIA